MPPSTSENGTKEVNKVSNSPPFLGLHHPMMRGKFFQVQSMLCFTRISLKTKVIKRLHAVNGATYSQRGTSNVEANNCSSLAKMVTKHTVLCTVGWWPQAGP